ncbi:MAG: uncharacterized protein KVP18_005092 [Porospora cf. gigantea A]|uniref:uncharacterized protein n=1 Tax=Porospora cf. gigantea A TaxID=2853593 RepID=UPI00355A40A8|nr:MAG: hypothetical protein KVP18_005092 [Porospora cf. gigantea A]
MRDFTALEFGGKGLQYNPSGKHLFSLVFMHGLGDSAMGWVSGIQEILAQSSFLRAHMKVCMPTADVMPVHWSGGFPTTAWFDIFSLDSTAREDLEGISRSRNRVSAIISHELELGVPNENIFVGGYSQGGSLAYDVLLNEDRKLGGFVLLSAWITGVSALYGDFEGYTPKRANLTAPIFHGHGTYDDIVKFTWGEQSLKHLAQHHEDTTFKSYPVSHSTCRTEMADVAAFLEAAVRSDSGRSDL